MQPPLLQLVLIDFRYVLSPTHLHEFKSADRVAWQTPVMSLYLPEQKLGSHSQEDSSSHKFMLKGRQTGAMHRGHSWVFRAESHETMMSWFEDIESLINKTGEARNAFVRRHVRSVSGRSTNSEAMEDDEADRTPYSAESVVLAQERPTSATRQPGGAFPSDVQIDRNPQAPLSPSSGDSSAGREAIAAAGSYPDGTSAEPANSRFYSREVDNASPQVANESPANQSRMSRHDSYYGDWIGPAAIATRQKQSQQADNAAVGESAADRETRSEGDHQSVAAVAGVAEDTGRRDQSAPPYVARRESVSTAPTNTNVTDNTHNTMATSLDDTQDSGVAGAASSLPSKGLENGIAEENPGAGGTAKTGPDLSRRKQDSMVTMDMKIPGRFPLTNVAA